MPNSEMRERARKFFPQALSGIGSPEKMYEVMADFATLERAEARRAAIEECALTAEEIPFLPVTQDALLTAAWYSKVVGEKLRSRLAAPEKEETNGTV